MLGVVYDPLRDEDVHRERGKGAFLNNKPIQASTTTELQKSLLVTGFPYDTWNTKQDNFYNLKNSVGDSGRTPPRFRGAGCMYVAQAVSTFLGISLSLGMWPRQDLSPRKAGARVTNIDGQPDTFLHRNLSSVPRRGSMMSYIKN